MSRVLKNTISQNESFILSCIHFSIAFTMPSTCYLIYHPQNSNIFVITLNMVGFIAMLFTLVRSIAIFRFKRVLVGVAEVSVHIILYFALIYSWIYSHVGSSFNTTRKLYGFDFIYYSITTFSTTGYGDITPVSQFAEIMASMEMIFGFLFSTFIMAIVVSWFIEYMKKMKID